MTIVGMVSDLSSYEPVFKENFLFNDLSLYMCLNITYILFYVYLDGKHTLPLKTNNITTV